MTYRFNLL